MQISCEAAVTSENLQLSVLAGWAALGKVN